MDRLLTFWIVGMVVTLVIFHSHETVAVKWRNGRELTWVWSRIVASVFVALIWPWVLFLWIRAPLRRKD